MATVTRTIYRKRYIGCTGREGSWREPCVTNYTDLRQLAADYGRGENEQYELVVETARPMTAEELQSFVAEGRHCLELQRLAKEREKDLAEFERLRIKLGR